MKHHFQTPRKSPGTSLVAPQNSRVYRAVTLLVSLTCGGSFAQTTNAPPAPPQSSSDTNVVKLAPTTVVGKLDVAREQIVPELGATVYSVSKEQIQALPEGENASLNQVLLRAPGMAQD